MRDGFFLGVLIILSLGNLYAQKAIPLPADFQSTKLSNENILWLEDVSGQLALEDIIQLDSQNKLNRLEDFNLGRNFNPQWIKFKLENQSPDFQFIIENPMPTAHLELYYQKDGRWQKEEQRTESFYEQMLFKSRGFAFYGELKEARPHTFYMRIASKRASIKLGMQINQLSYFHYRSIVQEYLFGLLYGALLIMAIYNLFVFFSTRDRNYLYYFISIFFNLIFQFRLSNHFLFFFPEIAPLVLRYGNTVGFLFFTSVLWFSIHFLDLRKNNRVLYYLMAGIMVFNLIMIPASFLIPNIQLVVLANLVGLITSLAGFTTGLVLVIQRLKIARFFMLSWIFFILGGVFYSLSNLGLLPESFFIVNSNGILIGAVMEVLFLSFALADKINILREEKNAAQQNALEAAQANALLIKEQNQILEQKVSERTKELQDKNLEVTQQNQEILLQSEELIQKSEEISAQRDFIEEKNQELTQKNRQIRNSINAAQTIQEAAVSYPEKLEKLLDEYFLIYHPRDVVSGDFYWLEEVKKGNYGKSVKVLAVVDCTGHGVPGAFMTLIGHTLLNQIVKIERLTDPAEILDRLHQGIKELLRQEQNSNNYGMDLSILAWESQDSHYYQCTFAGAKSILHYYDNDTGQLKQLSGDRRAIGGYQNESIKFKNQVFQLAKNSILYLATDGFADQNNLKRKRFGSKALAELLAANAYLPLDMQKEVLEEKLAIHMQGTDQRDDILLVGFQL